MTRHLLSPEATVAEMQHGNQAMPADNKAVLRALEAMAEWCDSYYPKESVTIHVLRCGARRARMKEPNRENGYRTTEAITHVRDLSCATRHRIHLPLASLAIEESTSCRNHSLASALSRTKGDILTAYTSYRLELHADDPLDRGLEVDSGIAWRRTFETPVQLAEQLQYMQQVTEGRLSLQEGAERLIVRPALAAGHRLSLAGFPEPPAL